MPLTTACLTHISYFFTPNLRFFSTHFLFLPPRFFQLLWWFFLPPLFVKCLDVFFYLHFFLYPTFFLTPLYFFQLFYRYKSFVAMYLSPQLVFTSIGHCRAYFFPPHFLTTILFQLFWGIFLYHTSCAQLTINSK